MTLAAASSSAPLGIRPMVVDDLPEVLRVAEAAFGFGLYESPATYRRWERRMAHGLETDPDGAFVALASDGRIVGAAEAIVRERLWVLSTLSVDPSAQGAGTGRALLDAALAYGAAGTVSQLIVSSADPRAIRLYATAGFRLLPTLEARGEVDFRRTPPPGHAEVDDVTAEDLDRLAPISRAIRGAPHTRELPHAIERGARILSLGDRGFAVAVPRYSVWLLVARDEEAATALLWHALLVVGRSERPIVRWMSHANGWAIRVCADAGLLLGPYGPLCVRGEPLLLHPYLPSPPFA